MKWWFDWEDWLTDQFVLVPWNKTCLIVKGPWVLVLYAEAGNNAIKVEHAGGGM